MQKNETKKQLIKLFQLEPSYFTLWLLTLQKPQVFKDVHYSVIIIPFFFFYKTNDFYLKIFNIGK